MIFDKRLAKAELGELRLMEQLIRGERFKLNLVKGNTLSVLHGQDWCKQQEAIIQLLENEKHNFISKCAHRLGFTGKVSLNLRNGVIRNGTDE